MPTSSIERAAEWAAVDLTPAGLARLRLLSDWLVSEAIPAGGIGPHEGEQLESRHLADSLLFAAGWRGKSPTSVLDLGTGIGLPTLPLAITHPAIEFVALDRSGRRIRLLKRALRILDLSNVTPVQRDADRVSDRYPVVISRAAIPPERIRPILQRTLEPEGVGVLGGSHRSPPEYPGLETLEIPAEVLDRPAWILIMAQS